MGILIKNIRKTAKGDLLAEIRGGKEKYVAFKNVTEERAPDTDVRVRCT